MPTKGNSYQLNEIYVLSLEYDFGELTLAAEYYHFRATSEITVDLSGLGYPDTFRKKDLETQAGYALISYRVCDWFELGMYYSIYWEAQDHATDELPDTQKDLAISTRFDINQSWLIKAESPFMGGAGLLTTTDNPETEKNFEPNWTLSAIKTTFNF